MLEGFGCLSHGATELLKFFYSDDYLYGMSGSGCRKTVTAFRRWVRCWVPAGNPSQHVGGEAPYTQRGGLLMPRLFVLLVLLLAPAFAQSVQVTAGSPFGINAGVRFSLLPLVLDGRVYAGANFFAGGPASLGGGADVLVSVPLTDLYAGAGLFYATGTSLSLLAQGSTSGGLGARGVIGTYLNLGLPLVGFFVEVHPMVFFSGPSSLGLGGAIGVNIGF